MTFNDAVIKFGLSEKKDGAMNLRMPDLDEECLQNRGKFFSSIGIDVDSVVLTNLVHGDTVVVVDERDGGQIIPNTDGLITNTRGLFLTVTASDCLPIYFFDKRNKAIGLAHAGWRGVVKNISKAMIAKMTSEFGSRAKDISAYIGPHIQKCHFEIKEDIKSNFSDEFIIESGGIIKVDLLSKVKHQLLSLGLDSENITSSNDCTFCKSEKYFSYRRDKPEKVESMIAYMGIV